MRTVSATVAEFRVGGGCGLPGGRWGDERPAVVRRGYAAALAVGAVATTLVVASSGGSDSSAAAGRTVVIDRGDVVVSVGGVGRVTTLTEAARLTVAGSDGAGPSAGSTSAAANAGVVFPQVTGHVTELLVAVGDEVQAGQPVAHIADDGTVRTAVIQARSDLATARLDLAQKKLRDPTLGPPPTAEELANARQQLAAARDRLGRLTGDPLPSDVSAAQQEVARAKADLETARTAIRQRPEAIDAAEQAVAAATRRLEQLTGSPDPAELAAAQLEVARAQLEQEVLLRRPDPPSAAAIASADAAVTAAQAKLTQALAGGTAADVAAASAELAKAQAEREALTRAAPAPSATAQAAAQRAVDAAQRKLDQLLSPPAAQVSAAQAEVAKARADLASARATGADSAVAAAQAALDAAQDRVALVKNPAAESVSAARAEVTLAEADLAVVRQRGAPASDNEIALARLRVDVAAQQLAVAEDLSNRLVVRAPARGTVTSVLAAVGAAVDTATPLVRLQDLDSLVVSVNLTEFDVSRTRDAAPVRIRADALGGRPYAGKVLDVALSGHDSGGVVTFPVIASVDQADGLRPGMSVSVRVVVDVREDVLRIPVEAIEDREGTEATVRVRARSGEAKERQIELGLVGATYAEVRSGLREGDRVLLPAGDEEA